MAEEWFGKTLHAQIIYWLLSVVLLLAVAYCAFFVEGFQQQMGDEGHLLEAGAAAIFLWRSYRLKSFIKKHKESNESTDKRL